MNKSLNLSLLLACALIGSTAQATIVLPEGTSLADASKASKKIFWDLHHVVVVPHTGKKIAAGITNLHNLITGGFKYLFSGKESAYKKAYAEIKKLPKTASGDAYIEIFTKYGVHDVAAFAAAIRNTYKPNMPVITLVDEVKKAGHEQCVASNIGPKALPLLCQTMTNTYKTNVFDTLSQGLIVNYTNEKDPSIKVGEKTYALTAHMKPTDAYFIDLNKLFVAETGKCGIFIDDSEENVKTAVKNGFIGVVFDKKNKDAATLLRQDLKDLNVIA